MRGGEVLRSSAPKVARVCYYSEISERNDDPMPEYVSPELLKLIAQNAPSELEVFERSLNKCRKSRSRSGSVELEENVESFRGAASDGEGAIEELLLSVDKRNNDLAAGKSMKAFRHSCPEMIWSDYDDGCDLKSMKRKRPKSTDACKTPTRQTPSPTRLRSPRKRKEQKGVPAGAGGDHGNASPKSCNLEFACVEMKSKSTRPSSAPAAPTAGCEAETVDTKPWRHGMRKIKRVSKELTAPESTCRKAKAEVDPEKQSEVRKFMETKVVLRRKERERQKAEAEAALAARKENQRKLDMQCQAVLRSQVGKRSSKRHRPAWTSEYVSIAETFRPWSSASTGDLPYLPPPITPRNLESVPLDLYTSRSVYEEDQRRIDGQGGEERRPKKVKATRGDSQRLSKVAKSDMYLMAFPNRTSETEESKRSTGKKQSVTTKACWKSKARTLKAFGSEKLSQLRVPHKYASGRRKSLDLEVYMKTVSSARTEDSTMRWATRVSRLQKQHRRSSHTGSADSMRNTNRITTADLHPYNRSMNNKSKSIRLMTGKSRPGQAFTPHDRNLSNPYGRSSSKRSPSEGKRLSLKDIASLLNSRVLTPEFEIDNDGTCSGEVTGERVTIGTGKSSPAGVEERPTESSWKFTSPHNYLENEDSAVEGVQSVKDKIGGFRECRGGHKHSSRSLGRQSMLLLRRLAEQLVKRVDKACAQKQREESSEALQRSDCCMDADAFQRIHEESSEAVPIQRHTDFNQRFQDSHEDLFSPLASKFHFNVHGWVGPIYTGERLQEEPHVFTLPKHHDILHHGNLSELEQAGCKVVGLQVQTGNTEKQTTTVRSAATSSSDQAGRSAEDKATLPSSEIPSRDWNSVVAKGVNLTNNFPLACSTCGPSSPSTDSSSPVILPTGIKHHMEKIKQCHSRSVVEEQPRHLHHEEWALPTEKDIHSVINLYSQHWISKAKEKKGAESGYSKSAVGGRSPSEIETETTVGDDGSEQRRLTCEQVRLTDELGDFIEKSVSRKRRSAASTSVEHTEAQTCTTEDPAGNLDERNPDRLLLEIGDLKLCQSPTSLHLRLKKHKDDDTFEKGGGHVNLIESPKLVGMTRRPSTTDGHSKEDFEQRSVRTRVPPMKITYARRFRSRSMPDGASTADERVVVELHEMDVDVTEKAVQGMTSETLGLDAFGDSQSETSTRSTRGRSLRTPPMGSLKSDPHAEGEDENLHKPQGILCSSGAGLLETTPLSQSTLVPSKMKIESAVTSDHKSHSDVSCRRSGKREPEKSVNASSLISQSKIPPEADAIVEQPRINQELKTNMEIEGIQILVKVKEHQDNNNDDYYSSRTPSGHGRLPSEEMKSGCHAMPNVRADDWAEHQTDVLSKTTHDEGIRPLLKSEDPPEWQLKLRRDQLEAELQKLDAEISKTRARLHPNRSMFDSEGPNASNISNKPTAVSSPSNDSCTLYSVSSKEKTRTKTCPVLVTSGLMLDSHLAHSSSRSRRGFERRTLNSTYSDSVVSEEIEIGQKSARSTSLDSMVDRKRGDSCCNVLFKVPKFAGENVEAASLGNQLWGKEDEIQEEICKEQSLNLRTVSNQDSVGSEGSENSTGRMPWDGVGRKSQQNEGSLTLADKQSDIRDWNGRSLTVEEDLMEKSSPSSRDRGEHVHRNNSALTAIPHSDRVPWEIRGTTRPEKYIQETLDPCIKSTTVDNKWMVDGVVVPQMSPRLKVDESMAGLGVTTSLQFGRESQFSGKEVVLNIGTLEPSKQNSSSSTEMRCPMVDVVVEEPRSRGGEAEGCALSSGSKTILECAVEFSDNNETESWFRPNRGHPGEKDENSISRWIATSFQQKTTASRVSKDGTSSKMPVNTMPCSLDQVQDVDRPEDGVGGISYGVSGVKDNIEWAPWKKLGRELRKTVEEIPTADRIATEVRKAERVSVSVEGESSTAEISEVVIGSSDEENKENMINTESSNMAHFPALDDEQRSLTQLGKLPETNIMNGIRTPIQAQRHTGPSSHLGCVLDSPSAEIRVRPFDAPEADNSQLVVNRDGLHSTREISQKGAGNWERLVLILQQRPEGFSVDNSTDFGQISWPSEGQAGSQLGKMYLSKDEVKTGERPSTIVQDHSSVTRLSDVDIPLDTRYVEADTERLKMDSLPTTNSRSEEYIPCGSWGEPQSALPHRPCIVKPSDSSFDDFPEIIRGVTASVESSRIEKDDSYIDHTPASTCNSRWNLSAGKNDDKENGASKHRTPPEPHPPNLDGSTTVDKEIDQICITRRSQASTGLAKPRQGSQNIFQSFYSFGQKAMDTTNPEEHPISEELENTDPDMDEKLESDSTVMSSGDLITRHQEKSISSVFDSSFCPISSGSPSGMDSETLRPVNVHPQLLEKVENRPVSLVDRNCSNLMKYLDNDVATTIKSAVVPVSEANDSRKSFIVSLKNCETQPTPISDAHVLTSDKPCSNPEIDDYDMLGRDQISRKTHIKGENFQKSDNSGPKCEAVVLGTDLVRDNSANVEQSHSDTSSALIALSGAWMINLDSPTPAITATVQGKTIGGGEINDCIQDESYSTELEYNSHEVSDLKENHYRSHSGTELSFKPSRARVANSLTSPSDSVTRIAHAEDDSLGDTSHTEECGEGEVKASDFDSMLSRNVERADPALGTELKALSGSPSQICPAAFAEEILKPISFSFLDVEPSKEEGKLMKEVLDLKFHDSQHHISAGLIQASVMNCHVKRSEDVITAGENVLVKQWEKPWELRDPVQGVPTEYPSNEIEGFNNGTDSSLFDVISSKDPTISNSVASSDGRLRFSCVNSDSGSREDCDHLSPVRPDRLVAPKPFNPVGFSRDPMLHKRLLVIDPENSGASNEEDEVERDELHHLNFDRPTAIDSQSRECLEPITSPMSQVDSVLALSLKVPNIRNLEVGVGLLQGAASSCDDDNDTFSLSSPKRVSEVKVTAGLMVVKDPLANTTEVTDAAIADIGKFLYANSEVEDKSMDIEPLEDFKDFSDNKLDLSRLSAEDITTVSSVTVHDQDSICSLAGSGGSQDLDGTLEDVRVQTEPPSQVKNSVMADAIADILFEALLAEGLSDISFPSQKQSVAPRLSTEVNQLPAATRSSKAKLKNKPKKGFAEVLKHYLPIGWRAASKKHKAGTFLHVEGLSPHPLDSAARSIVGSEVSTKSFSYTHLHDLEHEIAVCTSNEPVIPLFINRDFVQSYVQKTLELSSLIVDPSPSNWYDSKTPIGEHVYAAVETQQRKIFDSVKRIEWEICSKLFPGVINELLIKQFATVQLIPCLVIIPHSPVCGDNLVQFVTNRIVEHGSYASKHGSNVDQVAANLLKDEQWERCPAEARDLVADLAQGILCDLVERFVCEMIQSRSTGGGWRTHRLDFSSPS